MIQTMEGRNLADRIVGTSNLLLERREKATDEYKTRNVMVMPWINHVLGYNPFDPDEVVTEFTADVGIKRGEKVDYAIMRDGEPVMLIECKRHGMKLDAGVESQLHRYFISTPAKIGVLTDGAVYKLYSDIDEKNKMDMRPFLEFDMLDPSSVDADTLMPFTKEGFDPSAILDKARDLKDVRDIQAVLRSDMEEPSEDFVRYMAGRLYSGVKTPRIIERYARATATAFPALVRDMVVNRLKHALEANEPEIEVAVPPAPKPEPVSRETLVVLQGQRVLFPHGSLAFVFVLKKLEERSPGFLYELARSQTWSGMLTRDVENWKDYQKKMAKEMPNGWFVHTNINNEDKLRLLRDACEKADLPWGDKMEGVLVEIGVTST